MVGTPLDDKQKEQIKYFRSIGYGYNAIVREMKIPRSTVGDFCRKNNIERGEASLSLPKDAGKKIRSSVKIYFCCVFNVYRQMTKVNQNGVS